MKPNTHRLPDVPQLTHLNTVKRGQGVNNLFTNPTPLSSVSPTEGENPSIIFLPLNQIEATAQPRVYFAPEKQKALERSIAQHGILNPLIVRHLTGTDRFELVAGERRFRAAQSLNLPNVPVLLKPLTDRQAREIALIENLQREDLNALEETEGILTLLVLRLECSQEDIVRWLYRAKNERDGKVTQNVLGSPQLVEIESIFQGLGRMGWESFVSSRLPLLNLPEDLLDALRQGSIAYTKAKLIAKIKNPELRQQVLHETLSKDFSLSQLKERLKTLMLDSGKAKEMLSVLSPTSVQQHFRQISQKIVKAKLWKQADQWQEVQRCLQQIEDILQQEDAKKS